MPVAPREEGHDDQEDLATLAQMFGADNDDESPSKVFFQATAPTENVVVSHAAQTQLSKRWTTLSMQLWSGTTMRIVRDDLVQAGASLVRQAVKNTKTELLRNGPSGSIPGWGVICDVSGEQGGALPRPRKAASVCFLPCKDT